MDGHPPQPRQRRPPGPAPPRPGLQHEGPPRPVTPDETERRRLRLEKKRERYVWYYLAYFLFGIHIVAFVMIYAVLHAK
ncbi:hypothetical protein [Streptomyces sp. NPDC048419]|uniref:hypothetical protein n=1 Tax=Streptomyces sp. NPDC048419 TaxID=3365547 RepID=UPI0037181ABD